MLHTFFALLKFNLLVGFVSLAYLLFIDTNNLRRQVYPHRDDELWVVALWSCFWVITNIWIIAKNRRRIADSVVNTAIDAAASALDFKDTARARIEERRNNRQ